MKIVVVGVGYVGLVTGILLNHIGHEVICLDNDSFKINQLQNGRLPIYEPFLDKYLKKGLESGLLFFTDSYDEGLKQAEIVFIAVGTPPLEDGSADLRYVHDCILGLVEHIDPNCLIVIKSTVPPGSCENIRKILHEKGLEIDIASNPEFLREGSAVNDFLEPFRIVIGTFSMRSTSKLKEVYDPLTLKGATLVTTNTNTAEFIKYSSNAFLATKIAFINEMANLTEKIGADIEMVSYGMGLDPRIGKEFLKSGPGFGGSCFPKDIKALSQLAGNMNSRSLILDAVLEANKQRPYHMVNKIKNILGNLNNLKIGILGLTFKAKTDDLRESPALEIAKLIAISGADITAYDPEGIEKAKKLYPAMNYASSAYESVVNAAAIIILTEWDDFKSLDYNRIYSLVKNPIIIDLRNILSEEKLRQIGFSYYSIGR